MKMPGAAWIWVCQTNVRPDTTSELEGELQIHVHRTPIAARHHDSSMLQPPCPADDLLLDFLRSGPRAVAQYQAISVWVGDGDSPSVPVWIACGHLPTAGFDEPPDDVGTEWSANAKDEKVFVSWAWWRLTMRIVDQLDVPGRLRPPEHHQGVAALGFGTGAVKRLESETVAPEALGSVEIPARASETEVARRKRNHDKSIIRRSQCPRFGEPSTKRRSGHGSQTTYVSPTIVHHPRLQEAKLTRPLRGQPENKRSVV